MSIVLPYGVCRDCDTVSRPADATPGAPVDTAALLFPGERCPADHVMTAWESVDEVEEGEFLTVILDVDLGISFYEHDRGLVDRISPSHPTWAAWIHTYFAVTPETCLAARDRIGIEETPEPYDLAEAS